MRLRLATWNVNSVRLRHEQAARFVAEQAPDVLCLQEIKCREGEFPREAFVDMGLPHLKIAGQKGWHGVAIASRLPLEDAPPLDVCREGHARCVGAVAAVNKPTRCCSKTSGVFICAVTGTTAARAFTASCEVTASAAARLASSV